MIDLREWDAYYSNHPNPFNIAFLDDWNGYLNACKIEDANLVALRKPDFRISLIDPVTKQRYFVEFARVRFVHKRSEFRRLKFNVPRR